MLFYLSKKEKIQIKTEYAFRFAILLFGASSLAVLFWITSLVPSFIILSEDQKILEKNIAVFDQKEDSKQKPVFQKLNEQFNEKKKAFLIYDRGFSGYLLALEKARPQKIELNKVILRNVEGDEIKRQVEIRGVSPTRNLLQDFSKRLTQQPEFRDVNLPFSSFAAGENIPFSLSFSALRKVK